MRYFLDAEYNGFGGELISIALVPEDEATAPFYAALVCAAPTPWVAEHVLPMLDTMPVSRSELVDGFADYLIDDPEPLLVADWPEDVAHAARLLVTGPGRMKPIRSIRFELVDPVLIDPIVPGARPHNALSDATALRAAVLAHERRS
ncbi:MAG: hypothetical protein EOO76_11315 [Novosphingobium sp.]|nr:MAG: hypothetical protein EOO76_11315 [Novosphingobium sp.]